jgi:iron complex outermembrane receptor protein
MFRHDPACARVAVLACLPLFCCLFYSSLVLGQTTSPKVLPSVTVVGTRFEQQLLDEPVQTHVITADDILRSGARNVVDVLALQASIQVIDNSGSPNRQIDLRGFGMTGDQNTLILLDGQRLNENELASADLASIPLASIERIEIMRGSGAVLYGRGATGGTINIVTKKTQEARSSVIAGATIGSYGTRGVSASASLAQDRFGLNVFADRNETDNYRVNNRSIQENITASLNYRGDRGPISLRISSGEQSLRLPGERTNTQLLTDTRGATTPENFSNLTSLRVALATEQKFDWGFLALDVTHRNREAKSFFKSSGWTSTDLTKVNVLSLSPRIRIPFETGTVNHSLIIGSDWDRWGRDRFPAQGEYADYSDTKQDNSAFYARHTANFETGTSVALGARAHRTSTNWSVGTTVGSMARNLNAYELAIRQDLRGGWSLHTKAGTSFRLQTVDELLPYGSLNVLEPQTSRDFDAGIRFSNSKITAGISFFQIKLDNEIALYPAVYGANIFPENMNLPPTQRKGVELDAKLQVNSLIRIDGGYSLTDAVFSNGSVDRYGVSVAGKKVPLIPLHKATAAVTWKASEFSSLTLKGTYSSEARLDNDQKNTSNFRRPSFLVADLILVHEVAQWRLRASLLNLTDERYFTYGVISATNPNSFFNAYPAMGRSVLLTAERRF